MEKYMHRTPPRPRHQQKELSDCRIRKPFVEDGRQRSIPIKKMRLHKDTRHLIYNDSSISTFSQENRSARTSRSPSPGFDPLAVASNAHKISLSSSPPSRAKWVNRRLACFMAREYLSRGTLLGKPWPPQDSNMTPPENATAQPKKNLQGDKAAREREALYYTVTTDFLRSDDSHIPCYLVRHKIFCIRRFRLSRT
ncbi:uncharacterized protein LOC131030099 [Cryptomeria japonica]|uniref:uncharacterized protein LOC131030099 n=1 Tax=Cryptomeria japonica TaxID=3369 RepID=UPI0027D9F732|nr:uncharacterized protein LOC131030099 [Cryptomeria japonica]